MAQIFDIRELRAQHAQTRGAMCYCDAARAAMEHFSGQLRELYRTQPKPRVLCLETLEEGIPVVPGGWDFIYSSTFFNSLPASAARQVLKSAVVRLAPAGRLLIANVLSEANLRRCSLCGTFGSTHRGEAAMIELTRDLPPTSIAGQLILRDEAGINLYLELHKQASSLSNVLPLQKVG